MTEALTDPTLAQIRYVRDVVVQTARSLPDSDSGWTTQPYLRFEGGSEGAGQIIGEAVIVQDGGIIKPQTADGILSVGEVPDVARTYAVDSLAGYLCRLLVQDDDGTVTIYGDTYTAFAWGRIITPRRIPDLRDSKDTGGRTAWTFAGIGSALELITIGHGYVTDTTGSGIIDLGYMPAFNKQPGGDRSTATRSVNGRTVYVHELANATTGNLWTAQQILETVLATATQDITAVTQTQHVGWNITLVVGDSGLLDYIPNTIDLNGLTLLQAINALITPKRGMTWRLTVSGSALTITATSTSSVSVNAGSFTLPATSNTATLAAAGDPWIADLSIDEDWSTVYNIIEIRGSCPWIGLTGSLLNGDSTNSTFVGQGYGWSAAQETAWLNNPQSALGDPVYRTFYVKPDWNTLTYNSPSPSGLNNYTDPNGRRSSTTPTAPSRVLPGERTLPCSIGFGSLLVGPRQAPIVLFTTNPASNVWDDLTKQMHVEVQSDPLAVHIEDGQYGLLTRDRLTGPNAAMLVTFAVREHMPLRVWHVSDQSTWGTPTPTIKVIQVNGCEQWKVLAGTVTGVDQVGALTTLSNDLTVRDDTHIMQDILALAVGWYGVPSYRAHWRNRGVLDISGTYAPGRVLTSVQLGDRSIAIGSIITRRQWVQVERNGVRMFDTVYDTERIIPDLEAVL